MYDLTTIKRISKNNNGIISKYIQTFIKSSQGQLLEIDGFMSENKWDAIAEVLHKMKTSVAYFGMDDIEKIVIQSETDIRSNKEKSTVKAQIEEIGRLLTDSFKSLQKEIDSLTEA